MSTDRASLRGSLLVEDRRTERFFRELLKSLGFNPRRFTFRPAPSGKGDAKVWVRSQYTGEVRLLRSKKFQRLALVAVRDGDEVGVADRKKDLDDALVEEGQERRQPHERIATPVPTWSIETWILALLGIEGVDESRSLKRDFEKRCQGRQERIALRNAAKAWPEEAESWKSVTSLQDGRDEMDRLDL